MHHQDFGRQRDPGDSPLIITVDEDLTQINDGLLFLSEALDDTINLRTGETRIMDWSLR